MLVIERRNAEIVSCLNAPEIQQLSALLDRLVENALSSAGEDVDATE